MRKCTSCKEEKELGYFSKQKKKPLFYYAWCDACRAVAKSPPERKKKGYYDEVATMRSKTQELRKLSYEQIAEIRALKSANEKVDSLAEKYSVSKTTIYKALKGS